jgi:hypothetical protein
LCIATALSAFFDAKGFVYATQAWKSGSLSAPIALLSLANFVGGVTLYILSIGFSKHLGVESPAVHGVAFMDGTIDQWSVAQRAVGAGVAIGIAWLLVSAPH